MKRIIALIAILFVVPAKAANPTFLDVTNLFTQLSGTTNVTAIGSGTSKPILVPCGLYTTNSFGITDLHLFNNQSLIGLASDSTVIQIRNQAGGFQTYFSTSNFLQGITIRSVISGAFTNLVMKNCCISNMYLSDGFFQGTGSNLFMENVTMISDYDNFNMGCRGLWVFRNCHFQATISNDDPGNNRTPAILLSSGDAQVIVDGGTFLSTNAATGGDPTTFADSACLVVGTAATTFTGTVQLNGPRFVHDDGTRAITNFSNALIVGDYWDFNLDHGTLAHIYLGNSTSNLVSTIASTKIFTGTLSTSGSRPVAVTVGASVFGYTNMTSDNLQVWINGGTGSYTVNGSAVGLLLLTASSSFPLPPTNQIKLTFSAAPTMFTNR